MRKVRRVDPLTYYIIKVFGRRLENFVFGLLLILIGIVIFMAFTSHVTAAHGVNQNDAIWIFLITYHSHNPAGGKKDFLISLRSKRSYSSTL